MKESTKNKIKIGGMIAGAALGSCASTYLGVVLTTICPPVGAVMVIGKTAVTWVVSTKTAYEVSNMVDSTVDTIDETSRLVNEAKEALKEETQETKDQATA